MSFEVNSKTIDGEISCYRDRLRLECDFVINLPDGRYVLFEVKSSDGLISDGIANLEKMVKLINKCNEHNPNNTMPLPTIRAVITDNQYGYLSKEHYLFKNI